MAPLFLFESVNAQILVAKNAAEPKFMFGVLIECAGILALFQKKVIVLVSGRYNRGVDVRKEQWKELELEYIEAMVNNCSKCYEYVKKRSKEETIFQRNFYEIPLKICFFLAPLS